MRQDFVRVTCDSCGAHEEMERDVGLPPGGWAHLVRKIPSCGDCNRFDFCPECTKRLKSEFRLSWRQ